MAHTLVIGAGNFGFTLATELAKRNRETVVIDTDQAKAQDIKHLVSRVIVADASDRDVLEEFAKDADMAIVCLGEKVDSSILITHFLKELGVKRIIAKATSLDHGKILKIVGANEVVFPERDEAIRLAASLVSSSVLDLFHISEDLNIVEIAVPAEFLNKTIRELDFRRRFKLQILGVKNPMTGKVNLLPAADYAFQADDVLIVVGDTSALDKIEKA